MPTSTREEAMAVPRLITFTTKVSSELGIVGPRNSTKDSWNYEITSGMVIHTCGEFFVTASYLQ